MIVFQNLSHPIIKSCNINKSILTEKKEIQMKSNLGNKTISKNLMFKCYRKKARSNLNDTKLPT